MKGFIRLWAAFPLLQRIVRWIPLGRFHQQQKVDFVVPQVLEEILQVTDVLQERNFECIGEQTVEQIAGEDRGGGAHHSPKRLQQRTVE